MARTGRPGMSIEQKEKAWKLWRGGESYSEIGRKVGRAPGAIFCFFQNMEGYHLNYGLGLIELFHLMNVKKFRVA